MDPQPAAVPGEPAAEQQPRGRFREATLLSLLVAVQIAWLLLLAYVVVELLF